MCSTGIGIGISIASSQQSFLTNTLTPLTTSNFRTLHPSNTSLKTIHCSSSQQKSPTPPRYVCITLLQLVSINIWYFIYVFYFHSCFAQMNLTLAEINSLVFADLSDLFSYWFIGGCCVDSKNENKLAKLAIAALAAGVLTLGSVYDASAAKSGGRIGGQSFKSSAPRSAPRINNNSRYKLLGGRNWLLQLNFTDTHLYIAWKQ